MPDRPDRAFDLDAFYAGLADIDDHQIGEGAAADAVARIGGSVATELEDVLSLDIAIISDKSGDIEPIGNRTECALMLEAELEISNPLGAEQAEFEQTA